jgi:hypothetical protein
VREEDLDQKVVFSQSKTSPTAIEEIASVTGGFAPFNKAKKSPKKEKKTAKLDSRYN